MMFKSHIKFSVLKSLSTKNQSGYDLISAIGEFGGKKPSAGYIYPLLKDLEEKGFLIVENKGRRKVYSITGKGKDLLKTMQKNLDDMLRNIVQTIEPLIEKDEMKKYIIFMSEIQKYRAQLLRDMDVMDKFHKAMYKIYEKKNKKLREKLRIIIIDSTRKLENINNKKRTKKQ
jgi:DNA-binding PadR family transcriptional regulator